jgi:lipopolysaccharide/colanic/teichoic acid biosynthesis glycosyltransferase
MLRDIFSKKVLILGSGSTASMLIEEIQSTRSPRYVASLGGFDELHRLTEQSRHRHIVLASDDPGARPPYETLLRSRVRGAVVEDCIDFYERLTGKVAIEALTADRLALSPGFTHGGGGEVAARVISVVAALAGLALLSPLLLLVAIAVKLDSPGPVYFRQERIGRDGRPFGLLKFRTMRTEAHHSEWVRDNEHRITRIGKWLRRLHLDEVPQLLNVLRGEMNLVGPRPHPTCNAAMFEKAIPFYGLRSAVLPGITGWAQVRYGYANTLDEEEEKMRYDLYYIKNRSLLLDSRIVFETLGVLLWGTGPQRVRHTLGYRRPAPTAVVTRTDIDSMPRGVNWSTAGRS